MKQEKVSQGSWFEDQVGLGLNICNLRDVVVLRDDVDRVEGIESQPIEASPVIEVVLVAAVASLLHVKFVKILFLAFALLLKQKKQ